MMGGSMAGASGSPGGLGMDGGYGTQQQPMFPGMTPQFATMLNGFNNFSPGGGVAPTQMPSFDDAMAQQLSRWGGTNPGAGVVNAPGSPPPMLPR